MDPVARFEAILTPEEYAGLLDTLGFDEINARMQVYVHRLPDTASVIEWVKGTLLTQYRKDLGEAKYETFLAQYRTELLAELGDPAGDVALHLPVPTHPVLRTALRHRPTQTKLA